ncbi:MAG TPA: CHAT domain-containing protein [Nannocystaceae bacterium]|nr:CHAT domain-containing protein [Nannocystaceae bacterium]
MDTRAMLSALVLLSGCAAGVHGSAAWHRANAAYTMGNYPGAIVNVEKELAQADDPARAAQAHGFAIVALGKLGELGSDPAEHDAEARRHYDDGVAEIGDDPGPRARLERAMGSYFVSTHRPRQGLPHMRAALAAGQTSGDVATELAATAGMARTFTQIGELELGDDYLGRATKLGDATIGAEERPDPGPELDAWIELLDWTLQDALGHSDASARVSAAWPKLERALSGIWRASDKFKLSAVARESRLARRSILMMRAAAAFAAVGQERMARGLYERVNADLDMWGGSVAIGPLRNRLACTVADIEYSFGKLELAKQKADQCVAGAGSARDRAILESQLLTLLGKIRERADDLDGAAELYERDVARFEQIRAAIPIEERAMFFRGQGRVPAEGLVRVRMRQYAKQGDEAALDRLLAATDNMRARQLRELAGERTTEVSAAAVRRTLGDGAVVLSLSLAGDEISVVAIGSRTAKAAIVALAPGELDERLVRTTAAIAKRQPASAELVRLGQQIFGAVAGELAGAQRIIVVAEGALASFPVELLVVGGRALGERATIAYAPSLSFLARATPHRADDRFYAFGDPSYGPPPTTVGYLDAAESRAISERGSSFLSAFKRLPETRSEVLAIAELFDGKADVVLGTDASESTLRKQPPSAHAYVHFATHGILAGQLPGLGEPALVLANEKGSDGFLTASEVGALALKADLAVLSACSTGTGDTLPGEGVMGMGRAFLAAGSRGVVASLWPVSSRATEALMVEFYRQHRAGLDAGRALRAAKRTIAATPAWRDPYYWAAFVLIAEGGMLVDTGTIGATPSGDATGTTAGDDDRGLVLKTDPDAPAPGTFSDDYEILAPF